MARELAVVLVNGSLNSTVACALAAQRHRVVLLWVDARAAVEEDDDVGDDRPRRRFEALIAHVKPYRSQRIALPTPRADGRAMAEHGPGGIAAALLDGLPIVALGLRLAAQSGAVALYAGHRVGPDARDLARATEFAQIWGELVQVTCDRPGLDVQLPLLELEPWQVVDLGAQVNAPFQLSWDCERDGDAPCGACAGCARRDAAFLRSGRPDPQKTAAPRAR